MNCQLNTQHVYQDIQMFFATSPTENTHHTDLVVYTCITTFSHKGQSEVCMYHHFLLTAAVVHRFKLFYSFYFCVCSKLQLHTNKVEGSMYFFYCKVAGW